MERRGSGTIIGISSVAGERGRASNYVYGAAKAGFTAFLSGLRNRLAAKGVRVITVKPGFVATRMTEGMKLPPRLTAQPEEVAAAILAATSRRFDVTYVRPIWWLIMAIIRLIPEPVFKKLKL
jgi:short-subunit dehydrogenase